MNTFLIGSKLMTGERALANLPHELKMKNLSKPMIISEKMEAYPPFYKSILSAFDNDKIKPSSIVVYDKDVADIDTINAYVEEYKASGADSIVVVGREAVLSVAKGVKLAIEQGVKDISTIEKIDLPKTLAPLFVVPVFYGSGHEAKGLVRSYKDNVNYDFVSDTLMPEAIIVDPSMVFSPSKAIMASSIMYSLASSIIAYTHEDSNIMTRTTAMAAIRILCDAINSKDFKRHPAHNDIATSLVIAGAALYQVRRDELAIMSGVVSRHLKVPYTKVYSMLFPHYYEQILDPNNILYMEVLLPIIGEERYSLTPVTKRAEEVVYQVRALIDYLADTTGFRYNLSDFKMRRDDVKMLAEKISKRGIDYNLVLTCLERTF